MPFTYHTPPELGDAICKKLEEIHGYRCDIILIAMPEGDFANPDFISSVPAEIMETLLIEHGHFFENGANGLRRHSLKFDGKSGGTTKES